jgi:FlaA1/EpsC-like NDP-sugar epimerase
MSDRGLRVLIVGAGKAGELLAKGIAKITENNIVVVGFVDDDKKKAGKKIAGKPVLGTLKDLRSVVEAHEIEELIIAIPSERGVLVRAIIDATMGMKLSYKILPRESEVLLQDFKEDYVKYMRRVKPEDLLGGEIAKSDQQSISKFTKGKTVLITGAAGSIGSELSRQIAAHGADKIVFYDWWENGIFELRNHLLELHPQGNYKFIIGDIKDRKKLDTVMARHKPNAVFHAAAYKHVPLMEGNPSEAIKNNILGTKTVAELAIKHKVGKFILVSTDKAVNPTNVMGATKRAAEKIIHILAASQDTTVFSAVRFGNVINSNGSAIPFFLKQIAKGGPVTVTHEEITRFFMTIPEAVHLILLSWTIGENNDLFVLDMGEPVKIYDLAKTLIALEGYVPDEDIPIKIIGLRPGEKLYEEVLVAQEGAQATSINKIFRTQNHMNFDASNFHVQLSSLLNEVIDSTLTASDIRDRMRALISTYKPSE